MQLRWKKEDFKFEFCCFTLLSVLKEMKCYLFCTVVVAHCLLPYQCLAPPKTILLHKQDHTHPHL